MLCICIPARFTVKAHPALFEGACTAKDDAIALCFYHTVKARTLCVYTYDIQISLHMNGPIIKTGVYHLKPLTQWGISSSFKI